MASSIAEALLEALLATGTQLACVLGPAAACAVVLHQLQRMLSATLTGTFGWKATLVTGWIGVPVHELSHVAACLVFMHELDEVKLFAPDPETGTLGLVRHHAPQGNPWAAIGRLFIGVAPLLGGALALVLAARLLLPEAGFGALGVASVEGPRAAFEGAWAASGALLDPAHLARPGFWVLLYVATCVGAHLAPSGADLGSAVHGAIALVGILFITNLVAGVFGGIEPSFVARVAGLAAPVVGVLIVAVLCCAFLLVGALAITAVVDRARGGRGYLRRFAAAHWGRIGLGATAVGALAWAI